jgi:hypothetical protein
MSMSKFSPLYSSDSFPKIVANFEMTDEKSEANYRRIESELSTFFELISTFEIDDIQSRFILLIEEFVSNSIPMKYALMIIEKINICSRKSDNELYYNYGGIFF